MRKRAHTHTHRIHTHRCTDAYLGEAAGRDEMLATERSERGQRRIREELVGTAQKKNKASGEGQMKLFKGINRGINKGVQRSRWSTENIRAPQKWKSVGKC